jgi:uncharacterized zinc-type alcohol dehydrogenase-like protein
MIKALASKQANEKLEPFEYEGIIASTDVLVKVECCGICHSDIHLVDGDWGDVYPLVPGHEIVGTIKELGIDVTSLKIGQRVGIGWQCNSCGTCEFCVNGKETFCKANQPTCMGHHGGFADEVLANYRFVIPIPDTLESVAVAPLLCGGATVYTPIDQYAQAGDSVAVVGIGGLGHLAIQIAKAKGCVVTAISTSADKEEISKEFGATEFLTEPKEASYDLIINTAHVILPMHQYLKALRPNGTFVQVGIAPSPMVIDDITDLVDGNKKIAGSAIAHPGKINELLQLAAKHGIAAKVQIMPMHKVNEALDVTRQNKARFRMVLKN